MNLNSLGQLKVPDILAKLQRKGLAETLKIKRNTPISDGGGGDKPNWDYVQVEGEDLVLPCLSPEPIGGQKFQVANQLKARGFYKVFLQVVNAGARVDLLATDQLEVQARGLEPAKLFRIDHLENSYGVYIYAFVYLEE